MKILVMVLVVAALIGALVNDAPWYYLVFIGLTLLTALAFED